jgi:hypothetical protein
MLSTRTLQLLCFDHANNICCTEQNMRLCIFLDSSVTSFILCPVFLLSPLFCGGSINEFIFSFQKKKFVVETVSN